MKKIFVNFKSLFVLTVFILFGGCAVQPVVLQPIPVQEPAVPAVKEKPVVCPPVKKELTLSQKARQIYSLGIIGEVEPIRFPPMKTALLARIDTGAAGSSINAQNIQAFEREGKKWISFDVVNLKTGEKNHFEKRLYKQISIKRQLENEERYVVMMTVYIGKEKLSMPFSLSDRGKFEYSVLIGRNIIKGRAIVDPSLAQTLY